MINNGAGTITRDYYLPNNDDDYFGNLRETDVPTGAGAIKGAITSDGLHLYVANAEAHSVSAFSISGTCCALSAVGGQPFTTGSGSPQSIAITPDSRFVYVPMSTPTGGSIAAFRIDAGSGALTPIGQASTGGSPPRTATVSPDGRHLYVAKDSGLSGYAINSSTGSLSAIPGSPAATDSTDAAITPDGRFLYVAGAAGVNVYSRDGGSGVLTPVAGQPFAVGASPSALAIMPDGSKLYVGDDVSDSIFLFSIDAQTGGLTPTGGRESAYAGSPGGMTIASTGRHLLIASSWHGAGYLIFFKISPGTGDLFDPRGVPNSAGANPTDVVLTPASTPNSDFTVRLGIGTKRATRLIGPGGDKPPPPPPVMVPSFTWDLGAANPHTSSISSLHGWATDVYGAPGSYKATLRVDSGEGCPGFVFTGRTPYCSGSSVSRTTKEFVIPGELELQIQASSQRLNRKRGIVAYAQCAGVGCDVSLDGSFTTRRPTRKKKRSHARSAVKFKAESVQATGALSSALASESRTRIKLKFTGKGYRGLAHQLRSSKRVRVKISGTAIAGQQSAKATARVNLTKPVKRHKTRR